VSPGPSARLIYVPLLERPRLEELGSRQQAAFEIVRRARMILLLAQGVGPAEVARTVGCTERNVYKWRARWEEMPAIESLQDAPRCGRRATVSMKTRCRIVQIACDRPRQSAPPFRSVWTQQSLADELQHRTGVRVSRSTVQRVLHAEGLRPHKVRAWLHSPDERFAEKVERICDLYLKAAPKDTVILCIDEKPMQVLGRRFPNSIAHDGSVRRDYEYIRRGVRHLLGALNVKTGRVHGRIVLKRDARALESFVAELLRIYRGKNVIVIWDNLNIHHDGPDARWSRFNAEHDDRVQFVYTPVHASWVNQIEQWFSILQRRVLRHGCFGSAEQLISDVQGFIRWWNRVERAPFRWTFDGNFDKTERRAA
jgi:transposase